ncbi:MAG TPA: ketoacyl-ACP synthase III [Candidatus Borkfalkia avicola]|uniref:Beta-ketoacyl-[acyl-carrier-protein] synthase III n=1 Tax=Candidatus Borkfalkia avicola TaxID=2838503 RepID=A0A9D2D6A7_9FIRM|nr:ketoacyl-ACP synthase III [Candidatus Borkfalkia avicola]
MSFYIAGTGSALPEKVVSNDDLAQFLDTSDEWIYTRTGIRRRHVLTHERLDDLAIASAKQALADAGVSGAEVDLILCATMRGDTYTPSLACTVGEAVGSRAPAFDLNAACVGVLYAMEIADSFISSGKAETVLIVSAEAMSKLVDWTDRSTCVLFGDGTGAMVVKKGQGRLAGVLCSDPDSHVIRMPNFEGMNSPYNQTAQEKLAMYMDGGEVYKFAVNAMGRRIEEACARAGLAPADIDWYLPHQANVRIIDASLKKYHIPKEKVLLNIAECGNMSATSVMVLLDEYAKKGTFRRGDKLLLVAFGGGLTSGAVIVEWNRD